MGLLVLTDVFHGINIIVNELLLYQKKHINKIVNGDAFSDEGTICFFSSTLHLW